MSNHPRGVMPVSGRYVGTGDAVLEMSVVVEFAAVTGNVLASGA